MGVPLIIAILLREYVTFVFPLIIGFGLLLAFGIWKKSIHIIIIDVVFNLYAIITWYVLNYCSEGKGGLNSLGNAWIMGVIGTVVLFLLLVYFIVALVLIFGKKKEKPVLEQVTATQINNSIYCPHCGFINSDNNIYCFKCGKQIK